jgi:hypothetical protein
MINALICKFEHPQPYVAAERVPARQRGSLKNVMA